MYLSLVLMEKIRLIKTVSDFAKDQLGLESDFEPWNIFDVKEKYYLYASEKNFIQVPENFGWNSQGVKYPFEYFGTDFEKAKKRESVFKRNFSTLLFSAKATSEGLSKDMLKYSLEKIGCIVIHESVHNYIREKNKILNYDIEEAFSNLVSFLGSIEFSKKFGILNTDTLYRYEQETETFSKTIIEGINCFQEIKEKEKYFKLFRKKLKKVILTDFYGHILNYNINSAFFVRYKGYFQQYPELKEMNKNCELPRAKAHSVFEAKN